MSGLVILLVQHPDNASEDKYLELVKDKNSPTGDKLKINYNLDNTTEKKWLKREKQYMSAMRKLGTYPLKRVDPGHGSSIHYAGTIPFSDNEQSLTLSRKGRLHGCKNVFVADSSGFNYLPAPGLTFSLMANAHLVAEEVLKNGQ
jgi:choline dehydrogenase-like flavoprotein